MAKKLATILDRRVRPSMDPKRGGKLDVVILYQTEGSVQDAVILPEEGSGEADVVAAIRAQVQARGALVQKVIEI
jgi:hypothetical protein